MTNNDMTVSGLEGDRVLTMNEIRELVKKINICFQFPHVKNRGGAEEIMNMR